MDTRSKNTAIVWFRRDLRIADNPALMAAIDSHENVIPLYIHSPDEEVPWSPGAASNWWLNNSLAQLDADLRSLGSRLFIASQKSLDCLMQYIADYRVKAVYWNRLYEPSQIERDIQIKSRLKDSGVECQSCSANLLNEPHTVKTAGGRAYKVFSAYWRQCQPKINEVTQPLSKPVKINTPKPVDSLLSIDALQLMPSKPWYSGFCEYWQPGEAGAHEKLDFFLQQGLHGYNKDRNVPDIKGTSRLSPHLHFGEISPRQIIWQTLTHQTDKNAPQSDLEHFFSELGWREFAYYLMYHFPHTTNESLDRRFDLAGWQDSLENQQLLKRWQTGTTGIPIVDAGMRELWKTGWMHNRVRMIVASILTKNLGIHWLEGARWFWDTLVDADLACNSLGWQWTAGCGVDAAPYFRIFSPARQTEKFDPQGKYIKKFVPELSSADPRLLISGNALADQISAYPAAMIDISASRKHALAHWHSIKSAEKA